MQLTNDIILLNNIFLKYRKLNNFFPLIGAVLEGKQMGSVYVDKLINPKIILVVHKFRFAQLISEESNNEVWSMICDVIDNQKDYKGNTLNKIRFYCASPNFIKYLGTINNYNFQVGERIRFLSNEYLKIDCVKDFQLSKNDIDLLNKQHQIQTGSRFWNNNEDFLKNSYSYCVKEGNIIKSICYAAAVSNNKAEIDVATHVGFRKKGFAKEAVLGFIKLCSNCGIIPLWDCYENNIASVQTAISIGFKKYFSYHFLIISSK
tara:strand:+ start:2375 stop:3160 length:786 start_codon:yes stop_codon:yes gene_type:complete